MRWAQFADRMTSELLSTREVAKTAAPDGLLKRGGQALIDFTTARKEARERLAGLEAALFPPDPDPEPSDA